ncbi:hypothetical protein ANCCAN_28525, partial [Ancylostoma caninum]
MRAVFLCLLLSQPGAVFSRYIANDVVSDYGQVKELLAQYYRRAALKYGNDYVGRSKNISLMGKF